MFHWVTSPEAWVMKLTTPLFEILSREISGRDLILIIGGLFLIAKSTHEIHNSLEVEDGTIRSSATAGILSVIIQISILDIVFSLDSVITAVGLADDLMVMILAIVIAVGVMMLGAKTIGDFVDNHPTIKMLALSFLILVGVSLFGEGLGFEIPKGYIYFSMAFSVGVELLNIKIRRKKFSPVQLHKQKVVNN